jgi:hypothetical protein
VSRVGEKSGSAVEWTGMRKSGSFGYSILRARDTAFIDLYGILGGGDQMVLVWLLINTSIIVERIE